MKFNVSILPCVKILSAFYIHLFFCVFTLLIAWGFHIKPTLYLLQIPYYMAANFAILFVLTVLTSSVVVFFRDLNQIISVILLIGIKIPYCLEFNGLFSKGTSYFLRQIRFIILLKDIEMLSLDGNGSGKPPADILFLDHCHSSDVYKQYDLL